jgi:[acyl-carrier-protein] S-malonyltransferase
VIAGISSEIEKVLSLCIAEGGMNSKMLPIKAPYHSRFVVSAAEKFLEYIKKNINVKPAMTSIVSSINQRCVSSKEDIENEIADNIKMNINWNKTVQKLVSMNYTHLVECGIGKSLVKIGKFIEGDYKIVGFDRI